VRSDEILSAFVELERQVLTVTFYLESMQSITHRAAHGFRSGEVRIFDSTGNLECVIPFADAKSKAVKHCPDGLHRIALESFLIAGTPKGLWEPVRTAPR
jgi:hypothetical protein